MRQLAQGLIAATLTLALALSALAAPCANCEDDGDGNCVCPSLEATQATGFGGWVGVHGCDNGESVAIAPNPAICHVVDLDCTTNEDQWVFRCPTGDYALFGLDVYDFAEDLVLLSATALLYDESFSLAIDGQRVDVSMDTGFRPIPRTLDVVALGFINADADNHSGGEVDITTKFDLLSAFGAQLKWDGKIASQRYPIWSQSGANTETELATRHYSRLGADSISSSTVADNRITRSQARCLVQSIECEVVNASTGDGANVPATKLMRCGIRKDTDGPGGSAGTDTELCSISPGTSIAQCTGLDFEIPANSWAAHWHECVTCATGTTVRVRATLGCL